MEIFTKIDQTLMRWLVKRGPDGRPHLQERRSLVFGVISAGWYVWVAGRLLLGKWPSFFEFDGLVFMPLHLIYTIRAWREVERRGLSGPIAGELPKVEIPPARIIPPGEMPPLPRKERVKAAVRAVVR